MQRTFEMELEKLKNRIIKMGSLVELQINKALDALLSNDIELTKQVVEGEKIIDKIDVKIDKLCQRIFVLTQPVASDLRFIMAALKIDNDLERIGDIAFDIARTVDNVKDHFDIITQLKIDELSAQSRKILKNALDSFVNKDINLANEILNTGLKINERCQQIFDEIIIEMTNKTEVIVVATHLILIIRHLERIADHSRNIAESVIFMLEGKIVKHLKSVEGNKASDFKKNIDL
jgi:phosphate transport system protein